MPRLAARGLIGLRLVAGFYSSSRLSCCSSFLIEYYADSERTKVKYCHLRNLLWIAAIFLFVAPSSLRGQEAPEGFHAIFNGKDLSGWYAVKTQDPREFNKLSAAEQKAKVSAARAATGEFWRVENGELVNDGQGPFLTTDAEYRDFELMIEYKTVARADSGIYLKATPQVQIWDYTDEAKFKIGSDKGSGGLWNNPKELGGKDPLVKADKPFGEWNKFLIRQIGSRTSVWLNGEMVVDNVVMNNYWGKKNGLPLIAQGPIQLQTHGGEIRWRNVFVRELESAEANKMLDTAGDAGFESIYNGKNLDGWKGPLGNYEIVDGAIRCKAGKGGTIHTEDEYADFVARLEFKLPPGGNNGLAIRYPGKGDTAYMGMCELQVLDNESKKFAGKLDDRQYHGSAYGMAAAHRGYHRPVGDWNFQEVTVKGSTIKVELNGTVILDTDLSKINEYKSDTKHPGKTRTSGFFGLAGHNDPVEFRNLRIKKLEK
ncbi:MAG: hypothetical protein ACI87E_000629 [Mariniblastus sp.]|jgi:hypothetical protein